MLGHTGVPSAAELQGSAEPTLKTKAGVFLFLFLFFLQIGLVSSYALEF